MDIINILIVHTKQVTTNEYLISELSKLYIKKMSYIITMFIQFPYSNSPEIKDLEDMSFTLFFKATNKIQLQFILYPK